MSLTVYEERAAEVANGPDVFLVQPSLPVGSRGTLYAVMLPQEIGRFVLVDDDYGLKVMFRHDGAWFSVASCWKQAKGIEEDPARYLFVDLVMFGRKILRCHKVKEMTWKELQS